jgi:hypothetical protein
MSHVFLSHFEGEGFVVTFRQAQGDQCKPVVPPAERKGWR